MLCLTALGAVAQEAPQPSETEPPRQDQAQQGQIKEEDIEDDIPEEFDPTEELSEDLSTSFPIDI